MGFYDDRILPIFLKKAMKDRVIHRQRAKVVPLARGRVLEVGVGPGLNLPFYDSDQVSGVWGLEPSEKLRHYCDKEAAKHNLNYQHMGLSGEEIPADKDDFDTVVITYTLCTIPNVTQALAEVHRVLKPGGSLLFSEHGLAPDKSVSRWQNRLNQPWKRFAGGCHLNRDIPELLEAADFKLDRLEQAYLPGVRLLTYTSWGKATHR